VLKGVIRPWECKVFEPEEAVEQETVEALA
jgi:hypothetical protein